MNFVNLGFDFGVWGKRGDYFRKGYDFSDESRLKKPRTRIEYRFGSKKRYSLNKEFSNYLIQQISEIIF